MTDNEIKDRFDAGENSGEPFPPYHVDGYIRWEVTTPLGESIQYKRQMRLDEIRAAKIEESFWKWYIHRVKHCGLTHQTKPEDFPWLPTNFWKKCETMITAE